MEEYDPYISLLPKQHQQDYLRYNWFFGLSYHRLKQVYHSINTNECNNINYYKHQGDNSGFHKEVMDFITILTRT